MHDFGDLIALLRQVRWDVVIGLSIVPILLQLVAAIIHPALFNLVSFLTIAGIIAIGVFDGTNAADPKAFQAQIAEMACVALVVFIGHLLIRRLFMAMARATRRA